MIYSQGGCSNLCYFLPGTSQTPWWLEETDLFAGGGSISQGFEEHVGKRENLDGKTLPLTHTDTLINEVVILEGQRSDKNGYMMLQGDPQFELI